jgi:1-acyl-sn-glycerol-3-phosphate acyltransferase
MHDDIRAYVERQPRLAWRRFLLRGLIRTVGYTFLARVSSEGTQHIPAEGPCILMMSHISAIDPVVCMGEIRTRYVIPMTKIENTTHPTLRFLVWWWGAYTVSRETVDRRALETSIALLNAGQMILIAPEGTRHPNGLGEGKDGLAYVATKTNAVILPAAMSGTNGFRDRWKARKRALAHITFGRPFRLNTGGRDRIPRPELSQMTREAMYQLALTQPDLSLRGAYSDVENATTETLIFV